MGGVEFRMAGKEVGGGATNNTATHYDDVFLLWRQRHCRWFQGGLESRIKEEELPWWMFK